MTPEQYKQFIEAWAAHFPNCNEKINRIEKETGTPAEGTFRAWYDIAFSDITLVEAQDAMTRLHRAGELSVWNLQNTTTIFRKAVAEIRMGQAAARAAEPDLSGRTYDCLICRDLGYVYCWDVSSMKAARACVRASKPFDVNQPVLMCSAACTCERGAKNRTFRDRWGQEQERAVYDPALWVKIEKTDQESREALWEWATNHNPYAKTEPQVF